MSTSIRSLLAGGAVLLCQCASGPSLDRYMSLEPGDKIAVAFEQPRRNFAQTLLSESLAAPSDFYSSQGTDPFAKILSADGMQLLLDGLATAGYFEHAIARPADGGLSNLTVRVNDATYAWTAHAAMGPDEAEAYNRCLATFQNVYNVTSSFHVSKGLGGTNTVIEEHDKLDAQRKAYFDSRGRGDKEKEKR